MKHLLQVALIGLACACSQPQAPPLPEQEQEAMEPGSEAAQAPASTPDEAQSPSTHGSALTGTVSALTGDVSQLQGLVDALGGEIRDREIYVALPADTLFEFDKADIRPGAEDDLHTLATLIGKTQGTVELRGYADAKGEDAYNLGLSRRRADAVKAWLAAHGVAATRLQAEGYGEADPVAPNARTDGSDDPEGRAKNRRVEAIIPRS